MHMTCCVVFNIRVPTCMSSKLGLMIMAGMARLICDLNRGAFLLSSIFAELSKVPEEL